MPRLGWMTAWAGLLVVGLLLAGFGPGAEVQASNASGSSRSVRQTSYPSLLLRAQEEGKVRVIVELDVPFTPEGKLRATSKRREQKEEIADARRQLFESLPAEAAAGRSFESFDSLPFVVLEVDAQELQALADSPLVSAIQEDVPSPPLLAESILLIGADDAWAAGATGAGQVVAILDTGVDKSHPFLAGKVVGEACFSTTSATYPSTSLCPSPDSSGDQIGPNTALNCASSMTGCNHGTHVAGIAAGKGASFSGVAQDASIVAVQVFSRFDGSICTNYGMSSPCVLSFTSDQLAALNWLYGERAAYNFASANMSLGGGSFTSACDNDSRKAAIDNLRSVGIATVVAAGNNGARDALSSPACISSAVSVGATTDADDVAVYSNVAPFLSLLAPGSSIQSSVPGTGYATMSGTSMAAPHVAGAWAVLKGAKPEATVDEILVALQNTGAPVSADGSAALTFPRIQLDAALFVLTPGIEPTPVPEPIFADVPADYWAYPYIEALYAAGYIAGCSAEPRLYCPESVLTRAESAVFVERGQHGALPEPPYAPPVIATFRDVPASFWGFGWIESLWTDGFTAGCGTDPLIYCPKQKHTRAEGSVFFLRIQNGPEYAPPEPVGLFTDVDPDAWYAGWVEAAYNHGLLPACSEEPLKFCPGASLNRAWAAYMMVQAKGGLDALPSGTATVP